MNRKSVSKITATQNAIRNKFKKAYSKRLEHEHAVHCAMKPLTTASKAVDSETKNSDFSIHNLSKSTTTTTINDTDTPGLHSNQTVESMPIKKNDTGKRKQSYPDPNILCDSLRILLASVLNADDADMKCMPQMNAILDELRKLGIII